MISVVTPWRTLLSALGLIGKVKSECVLMSMKPGANARPSASITLAAPSGSERPSAAIRPSRTAMSPVSPGRPLPSIIVPPRIRMSEVMGMGSPSGLRSICGRSIGQGKPAAAILFRLRTRCVIHRRRIAEKQEHGMRTGAEYRQALRDGRRVWVMGEGLVEDVTTHPATRAMGEEYVAWYALHLDPPWQELPI